LLIKLECHLQFVSLYAVGLYTYLILLFIFAIFSFILFLLYQVLPKKKSNFFFFLGSLKSLKKIMILFFKFLFIFYRDFSIQDISRPFILVYFCNRLSQENRCANTQRLSC